MPILHFIEICMTQDTTENSRAPPMRHHGFKWLGVFAILTKCVIVLSYLDIRMF